jgi:[ribosomal protein S5]-alanine N-acetyltransferase
MGKVKDQTQQVVLQTDRLRFATWAKDDWREFQKLASDPLVVQYLGNGVPWPEDRVKEFVARQIEGWSKNGICLWKLLPKDSDTLVGICGLQPLPEGPDVEIGWWLAPSHWGQGLATEAARHALAYGFEVGNFQRIVAIAQAANRDSLRIMEKLGMRFEAEAVHKGIHVVIYAISLDRFNAEKAKGANRG